MANTVIQLKWSETTATPASLNVAEPAYSNNSNKLFIGLAGNQVVAIGGKYYTDIVDAATNLNTASTIVKRDGSGNFSAGTITAALSGNATTATTLQTARLIGVSGDITTNTVSFNGSSDANLNVTLSATGVTAATYGGATQIPTFVVDSKGRITSAANVAVSTTFNFAGNTGTGTTSTGGTLTIVGQNGGGITTSFTDGTDTFGVAVDATVVRTTGGTISGDLAVTGNLVVSGNTITQDVETIRTEDSLISLAANNAADAIDIGFFGKYVSGTTKYTGLVRQAGGNYFLFQNIPDDPTTNTLATGSATASNTATLRANITGGTVSSLASAITIADGGTGATSFTSGQRVGYNGTNLVSIANTTTTVTGGLSAANTITSITYNAYGDITAYTGAAIAIDTSQVTTGTLPIARGGTNQTTFTNGIIAYNGTSLATLANTGTAGTYANASHVPVITTDAYGRVSAVTNTAIAIDTSQVTSGTLGVTRGGTGLASYTTGDIIYASGATSLASLSDVATGNVLISGGVSTAPSWGKVGLTTHVSGTLAVGNGGTGNTALTLNGVVIGQGSSALTTVVSSTEGHVLQINASGVPTFAHLNGGSF